MRNNAIKHALLNSAALATGAGLLASLLGNSATANPLGAAVTTGSASVTSSSGKTRIDQKSENVVIDWSSFNIGAGQTTQFVQPNAQAIAVNRIGGNAPSQILGTLDANGRIVLINGNGMLFGKGSQVNVGSLIATSTGGSDSDVLSGKFTQAGNQNASVINQGSIRTSQGGLVALVAPSVTNAGTVNAKFGTVALGAANKFTVDFTGDGLVSFAAQGDVNGNASAVNTGSLVGANVSLTAHAAESVATGVVEMSGIVTAQTAKNVGGTILLDAGNGSLSMTGTLNAAGQTGGGAIETSGSQVSISGNVTAGRNGQWKVDPENLTINAPAATSIDNALNSGTSVTEQTTSGAASGYGTQSAGLGDIIVASPLAWNTSATLTLNSYHSIDIDAPITVSGAGGVTLNTNQGSSGGVLSFDLGSNGFGGNIAFTGTPNSGQSITINGAAFTLLYSMSDVQNINNNPTGSFALADNLASTGTYTAAIVANFDGDFEGLGHSISNITINDPSTAINTADGFFGTIGTSGSVSDLLLAAVNVTGGNNGVEGGLAGENLGAIDNVLLTGQVSGAASTELEGGLIGNNNGTIANSSVSGTVSGCGCAYIGGLVGANGFSVSGSTEGTGTVVSSNVTGTVSGAYIPDSGQGFLGGLAGANDALIENSFTNTTVTEFDSDQSAGGLVAENGGTITHSYALGATTSPDGGIIGGLVGGNVGLVEYSYATGPVQDSVVSSVGGLVGDNNFGTVSYSYATGNVSGGSVSYIGGLVGDSGTIGPGNIINSYATGSVSGGSKSNIGGLVGYITGYISNSFATGAVSGTTSDFIGGLAGTNEGPVTESFATGSVTAGAGANAGGLIGYNVSVGGLTICNSYATGNVSAGSTSDAGGLVGFNSLVNISDVYSIGSVAGGSGSKIGGLIGYNDGAATIYGFWDTQTSGLSISSGGNGLTTTQLENTLPDGFAGRIWGSGAGLLPYFLWQYPNASPQVISGTAYGDAGMTPLTAGTVAAFLNGTSAGSTPTYANGYYYLLLAPGTIGSGSDVLAYTTGTNNGASLGANEAGSVANLNILSNYLYVSTPENAYSTIAPDVATAIGDNSSIQTLVNGLENQDIQTSASSFSIDRAIDTTTLMLSASGTVTQSAPITAVNLQLSGTGTNYELTDGANAIGTLAANAGALNLADSANLTIGSVNGTSGVTATGAVVLSTGGSNLAIDAAVSGTTVSLNSAGAIAQNSAGIIDASTLTGNSATGTTLDGANMFGTLGAFANSGAGGISFSDGESLRVNGAVNAGSGNLSLTTTGTGNIVIDTAMTTGGSATLTAAGTLAEYTPTGSITAATLQGSSGGATTLNGANDIANLGAFANTGGALALTDDEALTIAGTINAGTYGVTLTGKGTLVESTGLIEAATLTGSTVGGATLNGANEIADLDAFTNAGAGGLALTNGSTLTVLSALNAGTGNLALTTTGAGSNIAIDKTITAGGTATLASAGTISEGSGDFITASELAGTAAGTTALNGPNMIASLGAFANTGGAFALVDDKSLTIVGTLNAGENAVALTDDSAIAESGTGAIDAASLTGSSSGAGTFGGPNQIADLDGFTNNGAGGFTLTDGQALTVDGTVNAGTGNVMLATTGTGSNIAVDRTIETGGTMTLTSSGNILEGADGLVAAETLIGSAASTTTLGEANQISTLGAFTDAGGAFVLTDGESLAITGALNAGTSGVTINDTAALSESGTGRIDAQALKGSSTGGAVLNGTNKISALNAFTNSGGGGFALTDAKALIVKGAIGAGTGDFSLTTTGAGGKLTIDSSISDGGTVTLISSSTLSEGSGGLISAAALAGSAAGKTTLNGVNQIAALASFTDAKGGFALTDAQSLTIEGPVSTGKSNLTLLVTSGDLVVDGALDAHKMTLGSTLGQVYGTGAITTALLNVTADTGIDLTGPNDIKKLGTNQTNSGPDVIDGVK